MDYLRGRSLLNGPTHSFLLICHLYDCILLSDVKRSSIETPADDASLRGAYLERAVEGDLGCCAPIINAVLCVRVRAAHTQHSAQEEKKLKELRALVVGRAFVQQAVSPQSERL